MTISAISSENLRVLTAQNAFMRTQKIKEQDVQEVKQDVRVDISSKEINTESSVKSEAYSPYVNEIKEFADKYGVEDINRADIQEALTQGTSLLADYTA